MKYHALGGVKIDVPDDDLEAALAILELPPPEEGMLRCPHCGSSDTAVRVMSVFGALCAFLKMPIPQSRVVIDCCRCKKTHDRPRDGKGP